LVKSSQRVNSITAITDGLSSGSGLGSMMTHLPDCQDSILSALSFSFHLLPCPINPVLSCPVNPFLSCPVNPVLSCPVNPVLSCPVNPVLSCPVYLSCPVKSCPRPVTFLSLLLLYIVCPLHAMIFIKSKKHSTRTTRNKLLFYQPLKLPVLSLEL
jgi:hypothetical protein